MFPFVCLFPFGGDCCDLNIKGRDRGSGIDCGVNRHYNTFRGLRVFAQGTDPRSNGPLAVQTGTRSISGNRRGHLESKGRGYGMHGAFGKSGYFGCHGEAGIPIVVVYIRCAFPVLATVLGIRDGWLGRIARDGFTRNRWDRRL